MGTLNKVILIGIVGSFSIRPKPQMENDRQRRILDMSVVTSKFKKDQTGRYEEKSTWHNIVVYSESIIDYILKSIKRGDQVYIEGSIEVSQNAADPKIKYWKIIVGYGGVISLFNKKRVDNDKKEDNTDHNISDEETDSDFHDGGPF